jgi:hypothetical protein
MLTVAGLDSMNKETKPTFLQYHELLATYCVDTLCLQAELKDTSATNSPDCLACQLRRDLGCSCKVRIHSFPTRFSKIITTRPRRMSEMHSKHSER